MTHEPSLYLHRLQGSHHPIESWVTICNFLSKCNIINLSHLFKIVTQVEDHKLIPTYILNFILVGIGCRINYYLGDLTMYVFVYQLVVCEICFMFEVLSFARGLSWIVLCLIRIEILCLLEYLERFGVLDWFHVITLGLFSPYFLFTVADLVHRMVKKGKLDAALELVNAFGIEKKFSPVSLVTSFLNEVFENTKQTKRERQGSHDSVVCFSLKEYLYN